MTTNAQLLNLGVDAYCGISALRSVSKFEVELNFIYIL